MNDVEFASYTEDNTSYAIKTSIIEIWNALPVNIKTAENLNAFKDLIKRWNGVSCNYTAFTYQ